MGGRLFGTQLLLRQHVQRLLAGLPTGEAIEPGHPDFAFLLAILQRHPRYAEKVAGFGWAGGLVCLAGWRWWRRWWFGGLVGWWVVLAGGLVAGWLVGWLGFVGLCGGVALCFGCLVSGWLVCSVGSCLV